MAGPWEKYQAVAPAVPAPAGPWDKYKAPTPATPPVAPPEQYGDSYLAQGMSGVNTGIADTFSLPTQLADTALSVGPSLVNLIMGTDFKKPDYVPDAGKAMQSLMEQTGAVKPETADPGKQFVRHAGETIGAGLVPLGGEVSVAAQPLRTAASELATLTGAALGGSAAEAAAPDNPYAELAGQILGGGVTGLAKGAAKKAITPFPASPERIAAADTMKANGVDLTAGQRTGSKGLQYAESELGGAAIGDLNEKQAEQFTQAVLGKAGINANRATPDVIDGAFSRIGQDFDSLAAKTSVPLDQQLQSEMLQVASDYQSVAGAPAKVVEDMVNRAGELAAQNGGVLAGEAYKNLRSKIGQFSKTADGPTKQALYDLQSALDDAVERHMPPDMLTQWQDARRQYKNMLVIEKASAGAGENAALGLISPAKLREAAVGQNKRGYVRGQGDFSEIAHAGAATMTPLPQSGTAPRTAVRNMGAALPAIIGAGAGSPAGPLGTLVGGLAGAIAPHLAGKAILTDPVKAYLSNQVMKPRNADDPRLLAPILAMIEQMQNGGRPAAQPQGASQQDMVDAITR